MSGSQNSRGAVAPFLRALSDGLNKISEAVLFAVLLLMVGVTTAQVVFRFFFTALVWSEELSNFLLVFASFLGAAVAFKRGSHISITFLIEKVSPLGRKLLLTLGQLLGLLFFGIVVYYGAVLMKAEAGQTTPALQISMTWIYLIYPAVGSVIILHLLDGLFTIWGGTEK